MLLLDAEKLFALYDSAYTHIVVSMCVCVCALLYVAAQAALTERWTRGVGGIGPEPIYLATDTIYIHISTSEVLKAMCYPWSSK